MVLEQFSLLGKCAIVTGCTSGIGSGIALGLAQAGADILGTYNSNEPIETQEKIESLGRKFISMKANLSDAQNLMKTTQNIVNTAYEQFGKADILVNNAGCCPRNSAEKMSEFDWDIVMNVNLKAVYFLSQVFANKCIENNINGKIINIASMLSYLGGVNASGYTASKHGITGITKALASEWAGKNINVNALAPGWIRTNLSKAIEENKERNDIILGRLPAGDWGSPDDFKGPAVFLASEASKYVHGIVLPVDGGYLTR